MYITKFTVGETTIELSQDIVVSTMPSNSYGLTYSAENRGASLHRNGILKFNIDRPIFRGITRDVYDHFKRTGATNSVCVEKTAKFMWEACPSQRRMLVVENLVDVGK